MLTAGDEWARTQQGNNNAYCQDNEISWLDWNLDDEQKALLDFTRELIRFRENIRFSDDRNSSKAAGFAAPKFAT